MVVDGKMLLGSSDYPEILKMQLSIFPSGHTADPVACAGC